MAEPIGKDELLLSDKHKLGADSQSEQSETEFLLKDGATKIYSDPVCMYNLMHTQVLSV